MKTKLHFLFFVLALLAGAHQAAAQGTAFTYQGQLTDSGIPANGLYDIRGGLYVTNTGGTLMTPLYTNSAVAVSNGLFIVTFDFGDVFGGTPYWLQIGVRTNGTGASFTPLNGRQQLTPTPYAIFAEGANATGLSGTIPSANLAGMYGGVIGLTNPSNSLAGNGSGLTGVNAVTLGGLASSNFWKTTGNSGTKPGVNFAGTTDSNAFEIHVNGTRILRFEPDSLNTGAGNLIGGHPANAIIQPASKGDVIGGGGFGGGGNIINSNSSGVFIGAGSLNEVGPNVNDSVIAGGYGNTNLSPDSAIGGGYGNVIQSNSQYSLIGGGYGNIASNLFAAVSGGYGNTVSGIGSFIGGGGYDGTTISGNLIQDNAATIGGGLSNTIPSGGTYAFIGGGRQNTASVGYATISGGYVNTANNAFTAIGGGAQNTASGPETTVAGGYTNTASGFGATVAGGVQNVASGDYALVGGGSDNTAGAIGSFIGGGGYDGTATAGNLVNSKAATIGGGLGNYIPGGAEYAFIGGGNFNTNSGKYATVGGGNNNIASGIGSFIGGGGYNAADNIGNSAAATASVIGGGELNSIPSAGTYATVAGGHENYANAARATIGGGEDNQNEGPGSVIAGGDSNGTTSSGNDATVGGGLGNYATGAYATVPGGNNSTAQGEGSFAAGSGAFAGNNGAFVWADDHPLFSFSSTNANCFIARCTGGVKFVTAIDSSGDDKFGVEVLSGGTSWSAVCDRNAKKNFQPVDTVAVLAKLAAVPIQQWNYKWEKDSDVPNIGPMAQDFKAAFYPGRDDKSISTLEFDGVELAAIQGLNQKLNEKDVEIQNLKAKNDSLAERLSELEATVKLLAKRN